MAVIIGHWSKKERGVEGEALRAEPGTPLIRGRD